MSEYREKLQKMMLRAGRDAHRCARLVGNQAIMVAPRRPKGVSAVRWRIELRRRANAKYYAECGVAI